MNKLSIVRNGATAAMCVRSPISRVVRDTPRDLGGQ